jgi:hypothetical protein
MSIVASYQLGAARVELYDGYTLTRFGDGTQVVGRHDGCGTQGQEVTARDLGYPSRVAMNRDHDLVHNLVPLWLGLRASPTLWGLAHQRPWPQCWREEAAVLGIQGLLVALGLDAMALAARYT